MLSHDNISFTDFKTIAHLGLGSATDPGEFAVQSFSLAREANQKVEPIYAVPADLLITNNGRGQFEIRKALPAQVHSKLVSSAVTEQMAIVCETERSKAAQGYWLNQQGWQAYLYGDAVLPTHLIATSDLWLTESRIGIGLNNATGSADDGKLFTSQAICPKNNVGFVVRTRGADFSGIAALRLGGDGRAAHLIPLQSQDMLQAEPDYEKLASTKQVKLVLTSPGLFEAGWLPTGATRDSTNAVQFNLGGISGKLVCAVASRSEIVSGFDLVTRAPKQALRAVATGSVYWLADVQASAAQLRKLANRGLWNEPAHNKHRQVEGFNAVALSAW